MPHCSCCINIWIQQQSISVIFVYMALSTPRIPILLMPPRQPWCVTKLTKHSSSSAEWSQMRESVKAINRMAELNVHAHAPSKTYQHASVQKVKCFKLYVRHEAQKRWRHSIQKQRKLLKNEEHLDLIIYIDSVQKTEILPGLGAKHVISS